MSNIGFTGTQKGMTDAQKETFRQIINVYINTFHHGDCVGADAEAHNLVRLVHNNRVKIILHPPIADEKRAFCAHCFAVWDRKPYLVRNRDVVDASSVLIAAPKEAAERPRSGTWSTVRYARTKSHRIIIILPNGSIRRENGA